MDILFKEEGTVKPALVLSSHTIGLGVIRALGMMGVPVVSVYYDKKDMGYVSRYVIESIHTPHPENDERGFLEALCNCSSRYQGGLLIPADDHTLTAVARNKPLLRQYYILACPDWSIVEKYIDKRYTYEIAGEIGVPVPKTSIPQSSEEAERYGQAVSFPCLIKPCESHRYYERFNKKMTIVNTFDELMQAYHEAAHMDLKVMIQEYIPGDDTHCVNYNSYVCDGSDIVEFTAEKVRYSPPGIGVPRVVISKNIPEVVDLGRRILGKLEYRGYSCVEFKRDPRDNTYKLMEINGRHNRSALLSVRCGINFPWIEYDHLVNGTLPSPRPYESDIYWIDELRDIIHSLKYYRKERYALSQYLRPYRYPHIFAILDFRDMKPFMKRCLDIMKMGMKAKIPVKN